ncbi:hypothetical protein [Pseudomonas sp. AF03-9]|uniref:hypothetical protein n=1 Tax=Pseudomonas sp. AF03-9 TaxID=2849867 RepID=UPI001CFBD81A|nr:hypothetical protein [Pseudomonas sp. AF03-9]
MSEIGQSIRKAQIFLIEVGEECTRLATAIKAELSRALHQELAADFWTPATWSSQSGIYDAEKWVRQEMGYSMPIYRKGSNDIYGYLVLQISLSGFGTDVPGNVEPLVHVGFWATPLVLPNYGFYFPVEVEGLAVIVDHGRLIRWHCDDFEGYEDEWTFSVLLTSLNSPPDVHRCVTCPVVAQLTNGDVAQALQQARAVRYSDRGNGNLVVMAD